MAGAAAAACGWRRIRPRSGSRRRPPAKHRPCARRRAAPPGTRPAVLAPVVVWTGPATIPTRRQPWSIRCCAALRAAWWLSTVTLSTAAAVSRRSMVTTGMPRSTSTSMLVCRGEAARAARRPSARPPPPPGNGLPWRRPRRRWRARRSTPPLRLVLGAPDDRGEERVGDVGDDDAEHHRRPGAQAAGRAVAPVAELGDRGQHPLPQVSGDISLPVHDPRHGRRRHPGRGGDVANGRRHPYLTFLEGLTAFWHDPYSNGKSFHETISHYLQKPLCGGVRMARVALLTMSDGRDFVARDLTGFLRPGRGRGGGRAGARGSPGRARRRAGQRQPTPRPALARRLAAGHPDLTIFHYPVWAFPHFTMLAAGATAGSAAAPRQHRPGVPGHGRHAGGGRRARPDRPHPRARLGQHRRPGRAGSACSATPSAGRAVSQLRGSTFGRIGGRPMGMYTAVADPDQWIGTFGVDVEEIDQWELVRRSESVSAKRVAAAADWLETDARPGCTTTASGSPASSSSARSAPTTRCASSSRSGGSTSPASRASPS